MSVRLVCAVALSCLLSGNAGAYDQLGGVVESDLAITTGGGGDISYAVFGRGGDNGLWWRAKVGDNWTEWDRIGDPEIMKYAPACITMDRRIHCAFVGTDNSVYLVYQPMTGAVKWDGPFSLGGQTKFSPTVKVSYASSDTPVFEVYMRGGGDQLFINSATTSGWTGWNPLGKIGGTPVCAGSTRDSTDPWDDETLCAWRNNKDQLFASVMANQPYTWWDTQGMSDGKPTITQQMGKYPYRMLVRGLDGVIWYNNYKAGGWRGWHQATNLYTGTSLACLEDSGTTVCASRNDQKGVDVTYYDNSQFME